MAKEAGKILELLSIEHVADSYRIIHEMQPAELVRHLESAKISTRGHMPELRARLLRFQVRKCHPYVHVPWYPEDDVLQEEKEKEDEEVEVIEEDSLIKSLVDKVDFLQSELEKLKIRYEEEKRDDASESGESTEEEEDNTPTNSDGEKSDLEVDIDFEPIDLTGDADDDDEVPDIIPDVLDEDLPIEVTDEKQNRVPDVAESVDKADTSAQYDWIQKECEKVFQNQSLYGVPTRQEPVTNKKNIHTPMSQPTWPQMKPKQLNTVYQPKYQYYPNPELMMNAQRGYYTDLQHYPNQYYMPASAKPYWL